ncbi:hypothetical protein AVEN_161705-1 [Araneus ventricosus]|uniref:Uncharacterized protein n=1 Tax=Araneus ventricosus TaxID=182803 RepID=A0A4Y2KD34_ARAVE|nr:hypothetical protein AVEN_161705-1 [Araneus ventricosus]
MMHESVLEHTRHLPSLSLQEMSLVKTITTLCNNRQLLGLILKCNFQKDFRFRLCARNGPEWKTVLAMADELISQICNCVLLKKRMLDLLWPVSYRIMLWKSIYAPFISNTFLQHFYWTDRGRIDNARTIRHLIGNKNISVRKRFVLACSVCLREEIHKICREMSNEDKVYFYTENHKQIFPLLLFWAHTMEGSGNVLEQYMDGAGECAIELGLLEAIKHLFAISTEDQRRSMADSCILELDKKINRK